MIRGPETGGLGITGARIHREKVNMERAKLWDTVASKM